MKINKIFIVWLFFVILWNFGVPQAAPTLDVLAAIIFSFIAKYLKDKL
tara:strand:- start:542 stop:685 length:144 start_codon:yes stop_codon:yes gene_type:complete